MQDELNPYAAPTAAPAVVPVGSASGLWRENKVLVMHKDAVLPNLCVKSGMAVDQPGIKRTFTWHNPWLGLVILVNILLYLIVAIIASKRATILIPLSPEERKKRSSGLLLSWLVGLGGVVLTIASLVLLSDQRAPTFLIFGVVIGIVMALFGLIFGQTKARILAPSKITKTHVWLKGVHPTILDQLPPVPAGMAG